MVVGLLGCDTNTGSTSAGSHVGIVHTHIYCSALSGDKTTALGDVLTDIRHVAVGGVRCLVLMSLRDLYPVERSHREKIKHVKERFWTVVILKHIASCAEGHESYESKESRGKHLDKKITKRSDQRSDCARNRQTKCQKVYKYEEERMPKRGTPNRPSRTIHSIILMVSHAVVKFT